ncbi:unnamed protein product [Paramecium sonneborni]|uniref:Uncharacterized protein n=1 Tax=Paramecium sonneborni TaxID=65129 RepID=A0A8S1M5M9_9CILI|nr:unnamed protein product [Paramecium sonneborni]
MCPNKLIATEGEYKYYLAKLIQQQQSLGLKQLNSNIPQSIEISGKYPKNSLLNKFTNTLW